jgi:hypothetical protein
MAVLIKKGNTVAQSIAPKASFIKTGKQANEVLKEAQTQADMAQEARSKPWRFRIPQKETGKDFLITFLDGDLDPKTGELELTVWSEHTLQIGGSWTNIVCLQPDYCPVCAKSDDNPDVIACFTVVDHSEYTIQKGDKQGQVVKNQRKLYIAKRQTIGQLQKLATKNKGLRGLQVEVSRSTSKTAAVGDMFSPNQKFDEGELKAMLGKDKDGKRLDLPFDYNEAAPMFDADKLSDMGFGTSGDIIGKKPGKDLSEEL